MKKTDNQPFTQLTAVSQFESNKFFCLNFGFMAKTSKLKKDVNQIAKAIVDQAINEKKVLKKVPSKKKFKK